ncbi:MAG: hypothetical protein L6R48_05490 [Planctomycetes bacterium]|jgi:hypothetical protein|nr:hypothetical protein [Planctomycetota bacterium]
MIDPACDHVLGVLDGAQAEQLGRDLEADLALLRARRERLAALGVTVQESPYVAFARRCVRASAHPPVLAASA